MCSERKCLLFVLRALNKMCSAIPETHTTIPTKFTMLGTSSHHSVEMVRTMISCEVCRWGGGGGGGGEVCR